MIHTSVVTKYLIMFETLNSVDPLLKASNVHSNSIIEPLLI